jgi:hypothetical protein
MMTDEEKERYLGTAQIRLIENTKKYAPLEYREVYLGEEVSGGDSIYINFEREKALLPLTMDVYADID